MMKKLLLLLVLCSATHIARADRLHDAIYSGDVTQVTNILSRTILTEQQLSKYRDFADHVLTMQYDRINDKAIGAGYRTFELNILLGLASMVGSFSSIYGRDRGIWFNMKAGALTGIFTSMSIIGVQHFKERSRNIAYSNALFIKKLLQDYECPPIRVEDSRS